MKWFVRMTAIAALIAIAASGSLLAQDLVTDSNAVIYEGARLSYVMAAPVGFVLEMAESQIDDYSFAFVPEGETYTEATVLIGVTIYSLNDSTGNRGSAERIMQMDTSGMRDHFGQTLSIRPLEAVTNATGQPVIVFYLEDKTRFMPNVMTGYFDGTEELVILELIITPDFPRFLAEDAFMEALDSFKTLVQGSLTKQR
jgi:hypothetical protein